MGIVAYYVDVDAVQLAALKAVPALVWNIHSDPRFAKASMVDIDREWEIVSWLASPKKRVEKCHEAGWNKAYLQPGAENASREEFRKLVDGAVRALGCPQELTGYDPILTAIEGRGTEKQREPALNFGLGGARLFQPDEVKLLSVSFSGFDQSKLRQSFNRKEMTRFDVGGMDWQTEPDKVLDEFLVPAFNKVSRFYQRAAGLGHYVLVIYQ